MATYNNVMAVGAFSAFGNEKGSIKNRTDCFKAHVKNNVKHNLPIALLGGATMLTAVGAANVIKGSSNPIVNKAGNVVYKATKTLVEKANVKPVLESVAGIIKKATPAQKGIAIVAAGAAVVASAVAQVISRNAIYNAGKIDQKYADKAQLEQKSNELIK